MSLFAVLVFLWVIEPLLLGAFAGWLSLRAEAPVHYWVEHPWRIFWITFPLVLIGWVMANFQFSSVSLILMVLPGAVSLLSAVQGLRCTWHQSRKKAILIFGAVWELLILKAIIQALFQEEYLLGHTINLAGGILSGPIWILASLVAEFVSRRLAIR